MGEQGEMVMAKPGLYANIHSKKKRIKGGCGEYMKMPGSNGAPSDKYLNEEKKTAKKPKK